MKFVIKNQLRFIGFGVFFTITLILVFSHLHEIKSHFHALSFQVLIPLILIHVPIIGLGGVIFYLFSIKPNPIKFFDALGLSFIANLLNQLLPYRPGIIFRYIYLKNKYQMSLLIFSSIMLVYLVLTMVAAAMALAAGWYLSNLALINFKALIPLMGLTLLILLMFLCSKNQKLSTLLEKNPSWSEKYSIIKNSIAQPKMIVLNGFIFILIQLFTAVALWFCFIALGKPVDLIDCVFISGLLNFAMILPITPGNLGVSESLLAFVTQVIYQDMSIGLSVALLFRLTQWIPSLAFGCFFSMLFVGQIIPKQELNSP